MVTRSSRGPSNEPPRYEERLEPLRLLTMTEIAVLKLGKVLTGRTWETGVSRHNGGPIEGPPWTDSAVWCTDGVKEGLQFFPMMPRETPDPRTATRLIGIIFTGIFTRRVWSVRPTAHELHTPGMKIYTQKIRLSASWGPNWGTPSRASQNTIVLRGLRGVLSWGPHYAERRQSLEYFSLRLWVFFSSLVRRWRKFWRHVSTNHFYPQK